jgi:hypothetical protein
LWPAADMPMLGADLASPGAAEFLREAFAGSAGDRGRSPLGRRLEGSLGPRVWHALRARALLVGSPPAWLLALCEEALGRSLVAPALGLQSPSGMSAAKAIYPVFERGGEAPAAIVVAMADPRNGERLRQEFERIETMRRALSGAPQLAQALPLAPLFLGKREGEWLAVVPPDPLAHLAGTGDRRRDLEWLAEFRQATARASSGWDETDRDRELEVTRRAWLEVRSANAARVLAAVERRLAALDGAEVPRVAVHGDFWSGNIARRGDAVRIYDWEWASVEGTPFHDLWTYEFGELLPSAQRSQDLVAPLADALAQVRAGIGDAGLDERFAAATLAPALAELTIRMRRATGRQGPAEGALAGMMAAAEELLAE